MLYHFNLLNHYKTSVCYNRKSQHFNISTLQLYNIQKKNKFAFTLLYILFAKNNRLNG
jgi:hypothetical protein